MCYLEKKEYIYQKNFHYFDEVRLLGKGGSICNHAEVLINSRGIFLKFIKLIKIILKNYTKHSIDSNLNKKKTKQTN